MMVKITLGEYGHVSFKQKTNGFRSLLGEMRRNGAITTNRRGQGALWELAKSGEEPHGLAEPESDFSPRN